MGIDIIYIYYEGNGPFFFGKATYTHTHTYIYKARAVTPPRNTNSWASIQGMTALPPGSITPSTFSTRLVPCITSNLSSNSSHSPCAPHPPHPPSPRWHVKGNGHADPPPILPEKGSGPPFPCLQVSSPGRQ